MTALFLQTALVLLTAYFAGTFLGCMLRRMFAQPEVAVRAEAQPARSVETAQRQPVAPVAVTPPVRRPDPEPIAPRIETIQRPLTTAAPAAAAPKVAAFEKALTSAPERKVEVIPTPAAAPVKPIVTPAPVVEKIVPAVALVELPVVAPVAAPRPAAPVVEAAKPVIPVPVVARPVEPPKPAPGPIVMPSASSGAGPSSVSAAIVHAPAPVDDLTLLRAIDPQLQSRLHQLGVRRFADIAGWTTVDIDRVNAALGFKGRIEHENWIEQAQILAKGGETFYSRRRLRGEIETSSPTTHEGQRAAPPVTPTPVVAIPVSATPIMAPVAVAPAPAAVTSPPAPPVVAPAAATVVSSAAAAAAAAAAVASPKVEERAAFAAAPAAPPRPVPAAVPTVQTKPMVAVAATVAPPEPARPAQAIARDQLQRLSGVNAEVEKLLNVQGVTRFAQIAGWSSDDVIRFDRLLGHEGRVAREKWIEQAQVLARGGETAYSREFDRHTRAPGQDVVRPRRTGDEIASIAAAPAVAPIVAPVVAQVGAPSALSSASVLAAAAAAAAVRPASAVASPPAAVAIPAATVAATAVSGAKASIADVARTVANDISGMRSVKSEAFRQPEPAPAAGSIAAVAAQSVAPNRARTGAPDDLKRIRGVGVLIEKKLNSMGVTSYDHIANWTSADIEKVSQVLDFKGRIERENWVEQARILSSGGHTEFSRRVDRGDVETSKVRSE